MSRFNPGDLVYLKSGGHHMTVATIKGDVLTCDWHGPTGIPHRAEYEDAQLLPSRLTLPEQPAIQISPDINAAIGEPLPGTPEDWRKKHGLS